MRWLVLLFILAHAQTSGALPIGPFARIGFQDGGDSLANATRSSGYGLKAGNGFSFLIGLRFDVSPTEPHAFEGEIGVGALTSTNSRDKENEVSWNHIPVEFTYFYRNTRDDFRLGWGLTEHFANDLTGRGSHASDSTRFDNAFGWVLAAEKLFHPEAAIIGF